MHGVSNGAVIGFTTASPQIASKLRAHRLFEDSPLPGKSFSIPAAGFHTELIGNPRAFTAQTELSPQL